jgi:hypothetical protein
MINPGERFVYSDRAPMKKRKDMRPGDRFVYDDRHVLRGYALGSRQVLTVVDTKTEVNEGGAETAVGDRMSALWFEVL